MDPKDLMVKREVVSTTNTLGWRYAMEIATNIVVSMERQAIDEEDDTKGSALRREAKAARKFLNSFQDAIEKTRNLNADSDDAFVEVAY